jgi:hypothetical protein
LRPRHLGRITDHELGIRLEQTPQGGFQVGARNETLNRLVVGRRRARHVLGNIRQARGAAFQDPRHNFGSPSGYRLPITQVLHKLADSGKLHREPPGWSSPSA